VSHSHNLSAATAHGRKGFFMGNGSRRGPPCDKCLPHNDLRGHLCAALIVGYGSVVRLDNGSDGRGVQCNLNLPADNEPTQHLYVALNMVANVA